MRVIILCLTLFSTVMAAGDPSIVDRLSALANHSHAPLTHVCRNAAAQLALADSLMLRNAIATQLQLFVPMRTQIPTALPLEEILSMIEHEQLDMHIRPTTLQLSTKRIIFRTMIELFHIFGIQKMQLQRPFEEPPELAITDKPLQRLASYTGHELWHNRTIHGLRALRIFSGEFVNEIIPNPKQKKWQEFAELIIPIITSHCIAFSLSKDPNDTLHDLTTAIAADIFARLLMVQMFLKKKNAWYFAVMAVTFFLAFYNSAAGDHVWKEMPKKENEGAFGRRSRYLSSIWGDKKYAISVGVDGIMSLLLYKIIDSGVEKVPIPRWLQATPVCQQPN